MTTRRLSFCKPSSRHSGKAWADAREESRPADEGWFRRLVPASASRAVYLTHFAAIARRSQALGTTKEEMVAENDDGIGRVLPAMRAR